jgi:hypothetical protein
VALVFAVVAGIASYRACETLPYELRLADAKYQEYRALSIADHRASDAIIVGLRADIVAKVTENVTLQGTVVTQLGTIATLNQTISGLLADEPPATPEEEALPIVINLRAQVKALREGFSLAQDTIEKQSKVILNLESVVVSQEGIIKEWTAKFNREQALRLSSESLNAKYKKTLSHKNAVGTFKNVVIGCLVVGTVSGLVK